MAADLMEWREDEIWVEMWRWRKAVMSLKEMVVELMTMMMVKEKRFLMLEGQGSKYRILESYRMGFFHIRYRISGEISGMYAHIRRSYWTLYIMKY